jgi:hypothetical protein
MIPVEVLMPNYLTKQRLLERGWTEHLIRQLLDQPDRLKFNIRGPHKIKLFEVGRVCEAETEVPFIARLKWLDRRKRA